MPDTRGDVLCPTCGQWTPPAPFCTECGAALQLGVQEPGETSPFRRGHEVDQPGSPWGSDAERFEPEPEDQAARAAAAGAAAGPRIDHLTEPEPPAAPEWPPEPGLGAAGAAAAAAGTPEALAEEPTAAPQKRTGKKAAEAAAAAAVVGAAAGAEASTPEQSIVPPIPTEPPTAEPPPTELPTAMPPPPAAPPPVTYAGPPRDGGDDSNGGVSGLVFVVFLGIGVLALLGGAILGGVFDGPVAEASPTPSVVSTPTLEPTAEPTPSPSAIASLGPSAAPTATPPPAADGFVARAEPCDEQPSDSTCDNSGAVNDGNVWILVSFRHAQPSDVIAVLVKNSSGTVLDEGSIPLSFCGTNTDCAGYTYFQFGGFAPGSYDVEATRNGEPAATTGFRVE
jgi:hypothetical protein